MSLADNSNWTKGKRKAKETIRRSDAARNKSSGGRKNFCATIRKPKRLGERLREMKNYNENKEDEKKSWHFLSRKVHNESWNKSTS